MEWFTIDKTGLGKLLARRGIWFLPYELISNGWDERSTRVTVTLSKEPGSRYATITVEDDNPTGFTDLAHAWTLFADSAKKGDAEKRGRFNLGEKLVLAMCEEAEIVTTTGGVRFDREGRHTLRRKRESGSIFTGIVRMTNDEMAQCAEAVQRLISPVGIVTTFNGVPLPTRQPIASLSASLPTELADQEGYLRPAVRRTTVDVYETQDGRPGWIYEMGVPIVETGDAFDVDVRQKVPQNMDRDNVKPAYLRDLRTLVLNATFDRVRTPEAANSPWVRDALADPEIAPEAVRAVIEQRFGKAVIYDPSDPEANKRAVSLGYTVVTGSQLRGPEWTNVKIAEALRPAGQVTPTPKPFGPDGAPAIYHPESAWTPQERRFIAALGKVAERLVGSRVEIKLLMNPDWGFSAAYRPGNLTLHWSGFGAKWSAKTALDEEVLDLLLHELGHHYESDHLSRKFSDALTRLGAKLAVMVAAEPDLLRV